MSGQARGISTRRGIITIALGAPLYIRMAKDLALSAMKHSPSLTRAVVSDSTDPELAELFHFVIPPDTSLGDPLFQKLWLDRYTPFEETLFIDSDSLVVGDVGFILDAAQPLEFGYVGQKRSDGLWYDTDIAKVCRTLDLPWLATLNSGMLAFSAGHVASNLFVAAREAMQHYERLGFPPFREMRADEVGFAIAFSTLRIEPMEDSDGKMMRTPIGIQGPMTIDALSGYCRFNKQGVAVAPRIVHFATWQFHPIYYRERAKLRLYYGPSFVRPLARLGGLVIYLRERVLQLARTVRGR